MKTRLPWAAGNPEWRQRLRHWGHAARARHWFPHLPLAAGLAWAGVLLLGLGFGLHIHLLATLPAALMESRPSGMAFPLLGLALLLMSVGVALRSRFAWTIVVLLTVAAWLAVRLLPNAASPLLLYYISALLFLLFVFHRSFNRSSVAAGTLFAVASSLLLLLYAVFGTLYLGDQFVPPIHDFTTALYYAVVTMGTVGYGDISARTPHARLFTISVIILGIAVFATSVSAVVGPLVSGSLNRIMNRKEKSMPRSDHYVIVGLTALALNTYHELKRRHLPVILIAPQEPPEGEVDPADLLIGDASSLDVLRRAHAGQASAVLAMRADDSENAFISLAVRELKGHARTVVAVNDAKHMDRVKLVQPDVIFAPQVLGGELLAMALNGEAIDGQALMNRFLKFETAPGPPAGR